MVFLELDDLKGIRFNKTLQDYIDIDSYNFDMDEQVVIGLLKTYLSRTYDLDGELAKTGNNRNSLIIKIMSDILIYNLYQKLASNEIPEHIMNSYNDVMTLLDNGQKRIITLDIEQKLEDTFYINQVDSNFRSF